MSTVLNWIEGFDDYNLVTQASLYYEGALLALALGFGRSGKAASGFANKTFLEGEQSSASCGFAFKMTLPSAIPGGSLIEFGQARTAFNFRLGLVLDDATGTVSVSGMGGTVVTVTVTHGGSYYGTAPQVQIVNRVDNGATYTRAFATVSGGSVASVTVEGATGFDPAHPPGVIIGPSGRGFQASATMNGITNIRTDTASSNYIVANRWYYIELSATVATIFDIFTGLPYASTTYELRVDGDTWLSSTLASPENVFSTVSDYNFAKCFFSSAGVGIIDDLYISAGEFLADGLFDNGETGLRIMTLKPNGVGAYNGFTPNVMGAENWTMVKDTTPDDDVTTVTSTQALDGFGSPIMDTYNMEDLPKTVRLIRGVQANVYCKKDKAGPGSMDVLRSDNSGGVFVLVTDEPSYNNGPVNRYRFISKALRDDFGMDWTVSQINEIQIGQRKS